MPDGIANVSEIKPHILSSPLPSRDSAPHAPAPQATKQDSIQEAILKSNAPEKTDADSLAHELKEQDLQKISKDLNEKMKRMHSDITFSYNEDIGGLVVIIKDSKGNRVIREIPPKEVIKLTKKMRDIVGILFDKKG
ncbi:flagellar protein FlaG [Helicobacter labacensis]|uniref:flagellar protein FlaG n=1 Tax=Helicobacter labacensis TaxID=2316079 RepID=UPI001F22AAAA|nr:flagellar protein FlaG [Helicobacter labacensis]